MYAQPVRFVTSSEQLSTGFDEEHVNSYLSHKPWCFSVAWLQVGEPQKVPVDSVGVLA